MALADFAHGYLEQYVVILFGIYNTSGLRHYSEEDMELHVWAYKRSREFGRRMACYRGEWPGGHPDFAKDSPAAVSSDPTPVPIDSPAIQYTEEDNRAIRTFVRESGMCLESFFCIYAGVLCSIIASQVVTTWHAVRFGVPP